MLANASNGSKEQFQTKETVRVQDNAFVGRSLKIEMVDDTALLNIVLFYNKDHHLKRPGTSHTNKDAPRKHKKTGDEPIGSEKKDKGNASTKVSEFQNRGETNWKRIMYSTKQMELMRFAHVSNQKKLWSDMNATLLLVSKGLVSLKNQKTSKANLRESGIGIIEKGGNQRLRAFYDDTYNNGDYKTLCNVTCALALSHHELLQIIGNPSAVR